MHWLNIAHIVPLTEAEGPGKRFVIWVQGCLKRCKGCCNSDLLQIEPKQLWRSSDIIQQLEISHRHNLLEGITLLGGEPFLQAEGLADIAIAAQKMGLSVMIFSGYQREELTEQKFTGAEKLLSATDVLIDGEYERDKQEKQRNWVGSTNQRFHYLTNFYDSEIETRRLNVTNEWRIDFNGKISGNGLPFKIRLIGN